MMLAAMTDSNIGVAVVAEVKGHRRDPHGGADAGGQLAAPPRRDAAFQVGQDLAEAPADPPMGADERALGRGQAQVELGQPLLVDPAVVEQDVGEGQGLLRVVGIKAPEPPAIRLALPGLDAVDVILDPTVVRLDLLGRQALQRGAQGVADGQTQQAPSDTVDSGQMRHRGNAPRMPNR